ncbi:MAG: hypothetical protein ACKO3N_14600 [Verrucomicrobiota bacterium]
MTTACPTSAPTLKRGARLSIPVEISFEGFDFAGCEFACELRDRPGGILVASLVPENLNTATLGTASLTLVAEDTAAWPLGVLAGDVKVSRTSPPWGPHLSDTFTLRVEERITEG